METKTYIMGGHKKGGEAFSLISSVLQYSILDGLSQSQRHGSPDQVNNVLQEKALALQEQVNFVRRLLSVLLICDSHYCCNSADLSVHRVEHPTSATCSIRYPHTTQRIYWCHLLLEGGQLVQWLQFVYW
jgi:hypothetical protein